MNEMTFSPDAQGVSVTNQGDRQAYDIRPLIEFQPQRQSVAVGTEPTITSLTDLQGYANGTVVQFPDFAEGQPLVALVRRPSMLVLAKQGKIPNALLASAGSLFAKGGGGMNASDPKMLSDMYDVCRVVCEATLIRPTLADIEAAGLNLADDQLMAIFNYTQRGVKALQPFRKE